jgi:hypothetical protein
MLFVSLTKGFRFVMDKDSSPQNDTDDENNYVEEVKIWERLSILPKRIEKVKNWKPLSIIRKNPTPDGDTLEQE